MVSERTLKPEPDGKHISEEQAWGLYEKARAERKKKLDKR